MPGSAVPVMVPVPLDGPFDYRLDEGPEPAPGTFVEVPFGGRRLIGVVWDEPSAKALPLHRLKPLGATLDAPPMPQPLRALVRHVASETLAPMGAVLRLAMSVPAALEPWPTKLAYRRASDAAPAGLSRQRAAVLATLADGAVLLPAALAKAAGVGTGVVQAMARDGLLAPVPLIERPTWPRPDPARVGVELTGAQRAAADRLCRLVGAGGGVVLLDGVPGAGKTEVYFEAVAAALRRQQRVLVLLPEIALSAQWLSRFERRFGTQPAVWHSALTPAQRRRTWRLIAEGAIDVVVGARSALFLPLQGLGLIVVDEEHDGSFKQEDMVLYHARDMAIARARLEGCPIVLASATPSVETAMAAGCIAGGPPAAPGWHHVALPARHGGATMPAVQLVDLRRERPPRGGFLSPPLRAALVENLAAGAQSLLFLNRRGYAPLTLCRACGHRLACPNCSAWLVAHRLRGRLQCHHCGYGMPAPEHCPSCGAVGMLAASGPGVERLAEELEELLPTARVALMTSDTIADTKAAAAIVQAMEARRVDVLIGTQIIAKGHHFPALTLVGVVDADLGLGGGDLRAAERTFQLLYQVSGRAGREERPGRVLIQTHLPEHPVMQALAVGDKDRFLAVELEERRTGEMPPFGRLAALIFAGSDAERVKAEARAVARAAPETEGIVVLGPAPAPLALLRGRYRERLLVKATAGIDLPGWLRAWLAPIKLPAAVHLQVDVDPVSFL
ncbi:primosomal protein N' [Benzoatithermus flavus]|uniref:Replication restart protein PriA n=1 Tax=Benzoatithermus flavus TaxID=3108223 RepID=A0ABU8XNW6_9PROT